MAETPKTRGGLKLWIPTLLAAALFLAEGVTKILAFEFQQDAFARWGYPAWSMFLIGGVETIGALALLHRRTAFVGALALLALMPGAIFTHALNAQWLQLSLPIIAVTLLLLVAWQRRPDWLEERRRPRREKPAAA